MTKKQRDAIAELLREHVKLQADDLVLKSILDRELRSGLISKDWREDFGEQQRSPAYLQRIAEGEREIALALAVIEQDDPISGFPKKPPKPPPN